MAYQNGSLKKANRKEGKVWLFRYRVTKPDGSRVENTKVIGTIANLPTRMAAWNEVDRQGLRTEINRVTEKKPTFGSIAMKYLLKEHGEKSGKAHTTSQGVRFYIENYLIPRWGNYVADEVKKKDVRDWLEALRDDAKKPLAGPTVSKIKSIMFTIYGFGQFEEFCTANPCSGWRLKGVKSQHVPVTITPEQARQIIHALKDPRHKMLVLVCACTAVRASEACGLRWSDVDWKNDQISINRRWTAAQMGEPKTARSKAPVPLHPVLAELLAQYRSISMYAGEEDYIFPSLKESGRVPLCAGIFVTDHLRPAAIKANVKIGKQQRFGLHSFRSSLATWLISIDKVDPKTAQGTLRHENPEMTLSKYAQVVSSEALAAQGRYLKGMGLADCGLVVGQSLLTENTGNGAIQ
jgi:integrase